jgi:DNA-binding LacI/PurR family transcriptional regulator
MTVASGRRLPPAPQTVPAGQGKQPPAGTLLARPDAPTAVITNSDYTALGIYKTARDLSLRIGPDVSVIGHDDLPTSELLDPPLATIRLDGGETGRALMARLLGGDLHGDYVAPVELVERASMQAPGYLLTRVHPARCGNSVTNLDALTMDV